MPVFNPFQPWTYQQQRKPGQPKPATTESPIPATARPVVHPMHMHVGFEGVHTPSVREAVKEMVVSEYLREMQARQAA